MLQSSLSWSGGICSNAGVCCQGKGMQEDLAEVEMGGAVDGGEAREDGE